MSLLKVCDDVTVDVTLADDDDDDVFYDDYDVLSPHQCK